MKKYLGRLALIAMAAVSLCSVPALADGSAAEAGDSVKVPTLNDAVGAPEVLPDLLYREESGAIKNRIDLYEKIADKLELTDNQRQQLEPIIQKYRKQYTEARDDYQGRIAAILGTTDVRNFEANTLTIAQRNQLRQVIRSIISEGKAHVADFRNEISPLLNAKQRTKLNNIAVNWYENRLTENAVDNADNPKVAAPEANPKVGKRPSPRHRMRRGPAPHQAPDKMEGHVPHFGPPPAEMVVQDLTKRLDLTQDQQEKILSILKNSEEKLHKSHQEVREQFKAQVAEGKNAKCEGKAAKCQGKDAKCEGKAAKCQGKDAKCEGKAAKCQGKDAKCQGKDAKCGCKDAKCQGKDAKCPKKFGKKHPRHRFNRHNDELGKAIREKIQAEREAAVKEITAVLTPDQQKKFAEIMEEYAVPKMVPARGHHPRGPMRRHHKEPVEQTPDKSENVAE